MAACVQMHRHTNNTWAEGFACRDCTPPSKKQWPHLEEKTVQADTVGLFQSELCCTRCSVVSFGGFHVPEEEIASVVLQIFSPQEAAVLSIHVFTPILSQERQVQFCHMSYRVNP